MKPPSLLLVSKSPLSYDIVYEKYLRSRIIIVPEGNFDDLDVSFNGKCVSVKVYDSILGVSSSSRIYLKRRIKSLKYSVRNGLIIVDVTHNILPFL